MTPRTSLTGWLSNLPLIRDPWKRRLLVLVLVALCGALALFPQRYRAVISLTPTDPQSLGLSGTLNQLGAVNSIFGNQASLEVSLKVAKSPYVADMVSRQLNLPKRLGKSDLNTARWLKREVDVRTMRGNILQIETTLRDAQLGRDIIAAFGSAVRAQLADIGRKQTDYKRQILVDLVSDASDRLASAQNAYDSFRLETRYSSPQSAIEAIGSRIPVLEQEIRQKEVELQAASRFFTSENFNIRRIQAEISALRAQLAEARSTSPAAPATVGSAVRESTQAERLRRELEVSRILYENYRRFLQGTSVEDLTQTANIRILEPAFIDPARQYNFIPMGIGLVLILLGLAIEFFNLRPPVGAPKPA